MGYKFEKDTSFRRKETTSLTHQGSIFSQTLFLKRLHLLRVMNRAILGPEYTFLLKHRWQKSYCEQFSTKLTYSTLSTCQNPVSSLHYSHASLLPISQKYVLKHTKIPLRFKINEAI